MRFQCKGRIDSEKVGMGFVFTVLAGIVTGIGANIVQDFVFIHWSVWLLASFASGALALAVGLAGMAAAFAVVWYAQIAIYWAFAKMFPAHDWKEVTTWFPWRVPENNKFGAPTECIWFEKVWKRRYRSEYRDSATLFGRVSYCQNDPRLERPHNTDMFFNEI